MFKTKGKSIVKGDLWIFNFAEIGIFNSEIFVISHIDFDSFWEEHDLLIRVIGIANVIKKTFSKDELRNETLDAKEQKNIVQFLDKIIHDEQSDPAFFFKKESVTFNESDIIEKIKNISKRNLKITLSQLKEEIRLNEFVVKIIIFKLIERRQLNAEYLISGDLIIFNEMLLKQIKDFTRNMTRILLSELAEAVILDEVTLRKMIIKFIAHGELQAKYFDSTDTIVFEESQEMSMLKCPNCRAPLTKKPPCTCEYCGVMIE